LFVAKSAANGQTIPALKDEYTAYSALALNTFRINKKPIDYIIFPNGDHSLQRPLEHLALQNAVVDWMRFWLKDEAPADPERAARWAVLRKQQDEVLKTPPPPRGKWVFVPESDKSAADSK